MSQTNHNVLDPAEIAEYVKVSGAGLAASEELITQLRKEAAEVRVKSAEVVSALVEHGVINPEAKEAAMRQMQEHIGAVNLLGNLLNYTLQMKQAYEQRLTMATQGTPYQNGQQTAPTAAPTSQAKVASYLGERLGHGRQSEADKAFWNALGRPELIRQ